jgi:general secretion pathway protein D
MKRITHGSLVALMATLFGAGSLSGQSDLGSTHHLTLETGAAQNLQFRNIQLTGTVTDVIQKTFRLYGVDVVFAGPIQELSQPVQIDLRDADLATASEVLDAMTHCFFVPLDGHLVLAVQDDKEHRQQYERTVTETIEVPNIEAGDTKEQAVITGLLNTLFGIRKATIKGNTVTIRAAKRDAIQAEYTLTHLYQPQSQVLLDVKAYLVSRGRNRNVGVQTPQQITVFNVDSELENLINSNSSAVQELIASGLVTAGDTLGIAEALLAGGYASNSVLSSPFVTFGGGSTLTGVQFGSVEANLNLNTSSSQQIEEAMLHLADDQPGTLKIGQSYPIMTASTTALSGSTANSTPSIQYEDLGLTLEAKPHIELGGEILLHLHEIFRSLDGSSLNSIPILDNQEFVADLSVPAGVTTVVVSNLSQSETRTAQGLANFAPTASSKNLQTSDLVITITPVLTRAVKRPR